MKQSVNKFILLLVLSFVAHRPLTSTANGTDPKANELAVQVLQRMGGPEGWKAARYISWAFLGQYQIWDKTQHQFRWEKDSLVAVLDLETKAGKVYDRGQEVQDEEEARKLLDHVHAQWVYNSFWLLMPFRLLEPDTDLKYTGEGKTQTGAPADILEVTFPKEGKEKYLVWIDKSEKLITQWALYKDSTDTVPAFIRRWSDYSVYGPVKLASDRSSLQSDLRLHRIRVSAQVPAAVFYNPLPVINSREFTF